MVLAALAVVLAMSAPRFPGTAIADPGAGLTEACFGPDSGQRIEACSLLLDTPLSDMERAMAYAMRALAYSIRGDYQAALPDYDRAIEIRPDFAVALNNRAWAYYRSGNPEAGRIDVEEALRLSPRSPHALDTRAHIRQHFGEREGALRDYRAAMRYGGARMIRLYQCGLQSQGLYQGPLNGIHSADLESALETCVMGAQCDPLPPDEECRRLTS